MKYETLKKYKHLYEYALHWIKTHGSEHAGKLANITIWFREMLDKAGVDDVSEYLGFTDAQTEEFYSWGHNSRWNHVFQYDYLLNQFDDAMEIALQLAEEFGDIDIEKIYFSNKENL